MKKEKTQTKKNEFSNNITTTERKPNKVESDRGSEFYNSLFHTFLNYNNISHFSRNSDKRPSIVEMVNESIQKLLKKPIFEKKMLRGQTN